MALKSSTGKIMSLATTCFPENTDIKKRLNLQKILESSSYREIFYSCKSQEILQKYFPPNVLFQLNFNQILEFERNLPFISKQFLELSNAVKYGAGYDLTAEDSPDYYSYNSVKKLSDKLKINTPSINITNISDENVMDIFKDDTIKQADDLICQMSFEELENPIDFFEEKYSGQKFCINGDTLEQRKTQLLHEKIDEELKKRKIKVTKKNIKILVATLLFTGICAIFIQNIF